MLPREINIWFSIKHVYQEVMCKALGYYAYKKFTFYIKSHECLVLPNDV